MPLSKKRMRERKRLDRLVKPSYVITPSIRIDDINDLFSDGSVKPKSLDVKPNNDALQSISRGIKGETDSTPVQPNSNGAYICLSCGSIPRDCICSVSISPDIVQPNCPDGRYRGR